jgi:hypothetical protein
MGSRGAGTGASGPAPPESFSRRVPGKNRVLVSSIDATIIMHVHDIRVFTQCKVGSTMIIIRPASGSGDCLESKGWGGITALFKLWPETRVDFWKRWSMMAGPWFL